MKKLTFLALIIPFFSIAQTKYLQAGAGYSIAINHSRPYYSGLPNEFAAEIAGGFNVSKVFSFGIGASYLAFGKRYNPYIPVYADIKINGSGKVKPYIFVQPGYGFYRSESKTLINQGGYYISGFHSKGGFYSNLGVGVSFRVFYFQIGHRFITFDDPDHPRTYSSVGFTAGVLIP